MNEYIVLRSYMVVEQYEVEAPDAEQAEAAALAGEGFYKSFDGDYDDEITVTQLTRIP